MIQLRYSQGRVWHYDDDGGLVGLSLEQLEEMKEQVNDAIYHLKNYDPSCDVSQIKYDPNLPF